MSSEKNRRGSRSPYATRPSNAAALHNSAPHVTETPPKPRAWGTNLAESVLGFDAVRCNGQAWCVPETRVRP